MDEDIKRKITELIARQLNVVQADIKPACKFQEDLEADSIDLAELILAIEDEFTIDINDGVAERLRAPEATVSDVFIIVESKGKLETPLVSEEIQRTIKDIISDVCGSDTDTLDPTTDLHENIAEDELDLMELFTTIEKKFEFQFDDDTHKRLMAKGATLADVFNAVKRKLA
ncbi:acyl carrier protein [Pseudomonas farsensis]|uniref:Acyl carrier protein n=1 Tax=Pseudomonas farsensis TaxID=2745492 RepID=A0ABU8QM89_9PSED